MTTVTIDEAQAHLRDLIAKLQPGEEVLITQQDQPLAKLVSACSPVLQPRQPGSAIGKLIIVAEDDEHLKDFQEYLSPLEAVAIPIGCRKGK